MNVDQQQQNQLSYKQKRQDKNDNILPPQLSLNQHSSAVMLDNNQIFEKFLMKDELEKPSFQEVLAILGKKGEWRNRNDIRKLAHYFQGLLFFENLKKDSDVEEDIINQCCRELKYRKYQPGEKIITHGEEGNEFFIIIKGKVSVYTPKTIEVSLTPHELNEYIGMNLDNIVWDRNSKYLYDQYLEHEKLKYDSNSLNVGSSQMSLRSSMRKSFQGLIEKYDHHSHHQLVYEFQYLTQSTTLGPGLGFGELALMATGGRKAEKRAATIISEDETLLAILEKDDFQKVIMASMRKKLDAKVEFFKSFRLSEGISRTNLNKLSYFFKEKQFRRRDIVYKEGDLADHIYFIKEGEFETTKSVKTKLDKTTTQKGQSTLLRTVSVKVSLIGPNQIIGLDDLNKDFQTYRQNTVQCVTEKAIVYYLTREEYYSRFYKNLQKHVINESQQLKEPFFSQRLNTLETQAQRESLKYLKQKERFQSRDTLSPELLNDCKNVVDQVQNEELCSLLLKHKLLKRPQIRNERITSNEKHIDEEIVNDYDPNRYSNKEYFLKLSSLYNEFMFNTNPLSSNVNTQDQNKYQQSISPQNRQSQQAQDEDQSPRMALNLLQIDRKSQIAPSSPYSNQKLIRSPVSNKSGAILQKQASTFQSVAANQYQSTLSLQQSQSVKHLSLKAPVSTGMYLVRGTQEHQRFSIDPQLKSGFRISLQGNSNNVQVQDQQINHNLNNNTIQEYENTNQTIESIQKPFDNSQLLSQKSLLQQKYQGYSSNDLTNQRLITSNYNTNPLQDQQSKIMSNIVVEESQLKDTNRIITSNIAAHNNEIMGSIIKGQGRNSLQSIINKVSDQSLSMYQSDKDLVLSDSKREVHPNILQKESNNSRSQRHILNPSQQLLNPINSHSLNNQILPQTVSPQISGNQQLSKFGNHARRQKSQTQLRPLNLKQKNIRGIRSLGPRNVLTLEDIQAHLQQSQNSLIKMLEQRIKEKHRIQQITAENNINDKFNHNNIGSQEQQQQFQSYTIDSNLSKQANSKILMPQVQLNKAGTSRLSTQQIMMKNQREFSSKQLSYQIGSAPMSPYKNHTQSFDLPINIVNNPQKSNIYFNMFITRKRL